MMKEIRAPSPHHTPPTRRNSEPVKGSPGEQQDRGLTGTPASPLAGPPDAPSTAAESSGGQLQGPLLGDESPRSQLSELEMEAVPEGTTPSPEERDISSSRKQSEDSLPTILENGADVVTSTSFNGRVSCHTWRDSSPPYKRSRKEKQLGSGPLENR